MRFLIDSLELLLMMFIWVLVKKSNTTETDKIVKEDKWALHLWNDETNTLNEGQKESIKKALKKKFQLIRGPPGETLYFCFNSISAY